jgi:hypothetical protein
MFPLLKHDVSLLSFCGSPNLVIFGPWAYKQSWSSCDLEQLLYLEFCLKLDRKWRKRGNWDWNRGWKQACFSEWTTAPLSSSTTLPSITALSQLNTQLPHCRHHELELDVPKSPPRLYLVVSPSGSSSFPRPPTSTVLGHRSNLSSPFPLASIRFTKESATSLWSFFTH